MAINLTPGEIYFIREKDLLTKEVSSYVKVGLVREGEDRGSEERASEHQTGNPRQLFVEKIVKTEAVSAVENMLHDHFANQRVSGEWFDFDSGQLQECIQMAEGFAAEAQLSVAQFSKAKELKDIVSTEAKVEPTPEAKELHIEYLEAETSLNHCQELAGQIREIFIEALEDPEVDVDHIVKKQEKKVRLVFDKVAFELAHPEIYSKYLGEKVTISGTFRMVRPKDFSADLAVLNPELNDFSKNLEIALGEVNSNKRSKESLHSLNLRLLAFESTAEWRLEKAKAAIQVLCGENAEIEGICKWARTSKSKATFDDKKLKEEHSELYSTFCHEEKGATAIIVNPKKPYADEDSK
jgi:hypothetical protein